MISKLSQQRKQLQVSALKEARFLNQQFLNYNVASCELRSFTQLISPVIKYFFVVTGIRAPKVTLGFIHGAMLRPTSATSHLTAEPLRR